MLQVHETSFIRSGLWALVPDLLEVLLKIAFVFFCREFLPAFQNSLGEFASAFLTEYLLILDHIALLIPSLLGKLVELYFDIPGVVICILKVVVVAQHEVLVIIEITLTNLLNEILEIGL